MKIKDEILNKILAWAQTVPKIKVIILEGSIAAGEQKDEFSDYDLNLFVEDTKPFLKNDNWFKQFDEIVVFQKEGTYYRNTFIPTRLVIYQNSRRVDFSWIGQNYLPCRNIMKSCKTAINSLQQ